MKYTFKILFFVLASSYTSLSALETVEDKFKNTVVQVKITTQHPNFLFPWQPSGLYFVRLIKDNQVIGADKIVIE